jgi:hypothetical protein
MKLIYSKDECVPDALTANQWLHIEKINYTHTLSIIVIDTCYDFFISTTTKKHYMQTNSCGAFEDIYEFETKEEWVKVINTKVKEFIANK